MAKRLCGWCGRGVDRVGFCDDDCAAKAREKVKREWRSEQLPDPVLPTPEKASDYCGSPTWDGTITHYVGETKFFLNDVSFNFRFAIDDPIDVEPTNVLDLSEGLRWAYGATSFSAAEPGVGPVPLVSSADNGRGDSCTGFAALRSDDGGEDHGAAGLLAAEAGGGPQGDERDLPDVSVHVHITRVSDGVTAVHWDTLYDRDLFVWTDGNYACDCNRELFFRRAHGLPEPDEDVPCTSGCFVVTIVESATGEILLDESESSRRR